MFAQDYLMGSGLRLRLRAPGFTLRAPGFRFWHPGFGPRAFSFRLRAAGSGPPASCAGLWTPGFVFKAERRAPNSAILWASSALRASGSELRTLVSGVPGELQILCFFSIFIQCTCLLQSNPTPRETSPSWCEFPFLCFVSEYCFL